MGTNKHVFGFCSVLIRVNLNSGPQVFLSFFSQEETSGRKLLENKHKFRFRKFLELKANVINVAFHMCVMLFKVSKHALYFA